MSTPTISHGFFGPSRSTKFYVVCVVSAIAIGPLIIWPGLPERLLASNFLPHQYCDLRNPGLLWTHAVADSLIGIAYLAISVTLGIPGLQGTSRYPPSLDVPGVRAIHHCVWQHPFHGSYHDLDTCLCFLRGGKAIYCRGFAHHCGRASLYRSANPHSCATRENVRGKIQPGCAPARNEKKRCCGRFIIG